MRCTPAVGAAALAALASVAIGCGGDDGMHCPTLIFNSDRDRPDANAPHTAAEQEIFVSEENCDRRPLTDNDAVDEDPSWSPDATDIVFTSGRDGNREIYTINADGSGPRRLTINPATDKDPAWGPNGDRIAFASTRGGGNFDIFVMTETGNGLRGITPDRLTSDGANDAGPSWSPDGSRIVFTSDRGGDEEIYSMNLDGVYVKRLTNHPGRDFAPEWSPAGDEIAFIRADSTGATHLAVMSADGSNVRELPKPALDAVTWSPDAQRLAYTESVSGDVEIRWTTSTGGDLSGPWGMLPSIEGNPRWRPSGNLGCKPRPADFGGGNFPAACWRPFRDDSPFNTPLPKAPKLVFPEDEIDKIIERIRGDLSINKKPANLLANVNGEVGEPTIYTRSGAGYPVLGFDCTAFGGLCSLEGRNVPVPPGVRVELGSSDRHLAIVDANARLEYDLWQVQPDTTPTSDGVLTLSFGGVSRLNGNGLNEEPPAGNATAAHFANIAGRLRVEELQAGAINHALFIVIECHDGTAVFPAREAPTQSRCAQTLNAPPMGSRLWLDMTDEEIEALDATRFPRWKKAILHAAASYGLFFGDTGTDFYFAIEQEAGSQYVDVGQSDRWLDFAKSPGSGWTFDTPTNNYVGSLAGADPNFGDVWSLLRVVAPCVSERTC